MSAQTTALSGLAARINSNSLTSADQAALLAGLAIVIDNWQDAGVGIGGVVPGGIPPASADAWYGALIPIALGLA